MKSIYVFFGIVSLIMCSSSVDSQNYNEWAKENRNFILNYNDIVFSNPRIYTKEVIDIRVQDGSVTSKGLVLVGTNKSKYSLSAFARFTLEKKIDNEYKKLDIKDYFSRYSFDDIEPFTFRGRTNFEVPVDWTELYGEIDQGEYRITLSFSNHKYEIEFIY